MILSLAEFDRYVGGALEYLLLEHFTDVDALIDDFLMVTEFTIVPKSFKAIYTLSAGGMAQYSVLRKSFLAYARNMRKCLYASLPLGLRLRYAHRFSPVGQVGKPGDPVLTDSRTGCKVEYVHRSETVPHMRVNVVFLQGPSVFVEVVAREANLWINNSKDCVSLGGHIVTAALIESSRSDTFYLHVTRLLPNMEGLDYVYVFPDFEKEHVAGNMLVVQDDRAIDIMGNMLPIPLL